MITNADETSRYTIPSLTSKLLDVTAQCYEYSQLPSASYPRIFFGHVISRAINLTLLPMTFVIDGLANLIFRPFIFLIDSGLCFLEGLVNPKSAHERYRKNNFPMNSIQQKTITDLTSQLLNSLKIEEKFENLSKNIEKTHQEISSLSEKNLEETIRMNNTLQAQLTTQSLTAKQFEKKFELFSLNSGKDLQKISTLSQKNLELTGTASNSLQKVSLIMSAENPELRNILIQESKEKKEKRAFSDPKKWKAYEKNEIIADFATRKAQLRQTGLLEEHEDFQNSKTKFEYAPENSAALKEKIELDTNVRYVTLEATGCFTHEQIKDYFDNDARSTIYKYQDDLFHKALKINDLNKEISNLKKDVTNLTNDNELKDLHIKRLSGRTKRRNDLPEDSPFNIMPKSPIKQPPMSPTKFSQKKQITYSSTPCKQEYYDVQRQLF